MTVQVKDWWGMLELVFIVETFRPWMKRFNERCRWGCASGRPFAIYFVDREFWQSLGEYGETH